MHTLTTACAHPAGCRVGQRSDVNAASATTVMVASPVPLNPLLLKVENTYVAATLALSADLWFEVNDDMGQHDAGSGEVMTFEPCKMTEQSGAM